MAYILGNDEIRSLISNYLHDISFFRMNTMNGKDF